MSFDSVTQQCLNLLFLEHKHQRTMFSNPFNYSYFLLKPQKKGPRIIKIIKTASMNLTSHFTVTKSGESTKTKQMLIVLEKNW